MPGFQGLRRAPIIFQELVTAWKTNVLPMYKYSTCKHHAHILEKKLLPEFGSLPLDRISRQHIQQYIAQLQSSGFPCPVGLSGGPVLLARDPKTVTGVVALHVKPPLEIVLKDRRRIVASFHQKVHGLGASVSPKKGTLSVLNCWRLADS